MMSLTKNQLLLTSHFTEEKYSILCNRLQHELQLLDNKMIPYRTSFKPLYQKKFGYRVLMEIQFIYMEYSFFMYITEMYPFERPIVKIDRISKLYKQYRVQDGLEESVISSLHSYISAFIEDDTHICDLVSINELLDLDVEEVKSFLYRFEKYYSPTVHLYELYEYVCRGIDLI